MNNNAETGTPLGALFDTRRGGSHQEREAKARAASLVLHLRRCLADEAPEGWQPMLARLATELPALEAEGLLPRSLLTALRAGESQVRRLRHEPPALRRGPWLREPVPARVAGLPGMDGEDSLRYYCWVGRQLAGLGDVVEVGCGLGQSTSALATGMAAGRAARAATIHAYDSFVWRPWMNAYVGARATGEDFLPSFRESVAPCDVAVRPHRRQFGRDGARPDGPVPVPQRPVELFVYDLGPDRDVLEECWSAFAPSLIGGSSLVVFNEYGSVRAAELWEFCAAHGAELVPLHKPHGTLKTFRYVC